MSTATLELAEELERPFRDIPEWITSDTLYEIIDGEYVEKEPVSATARRLANVFCRIINNHAIKDHGEAMCEMLIELAGQTRSRQPDVLYVSYDRWAKGQEMPNVDAWDITPEICMEVISPTDRFAAVKEKMEEYFAAGVTQVWIVTPSVKLLEIYTSMTQCTGYQVGDIVDCNIIIPGFKLNLADVL